MYIHTKITHTHAHTYTRGLVEDVSEFALRWAQISELQRQKMYIYIKITHTHTHTHARARAHTHTLTFQRLRCAGRRLVNCSAKWKSNKTSYSPTCKRLLSICTHTVIYIHSHTCVYYTHTHTHTHTIIQRLMDIQGQQQKQQEFSSQQYNELHQQMSVQLYEEEDTHQFI